MLERLENAVETLQTLADNGKSTTKANLCDYLQTTTGSLSNARFCCNEKHPGVVKKYDKA